MTEQPVVAKIKKREIIKLIVIFIFVVLIIFFVYKKFFKKEITDSAAKKGAVTVGEVNLSPSFSIKIQDILNDFKFINLKIFSKPIEESGASGNPNPFLPYVKKQDNVKE